HLDVIQGAKRRSLGAKPRSPEPQARSLAAPKAQRSLAPAQRERSLAGAERPRSPSAAATQGDSMDISDRHEYDVLVIGAGGAGLRAAIEAVAQGARVGLVCKSLLGKAHTVMAEGGVAAALATVRSEDRWEVHFRDTMRGGKGMNDWRMA